MKATRQAKALLLSLTASATFGFCAAAAVTNQATCTVVERGPHHRVCEQAVAFTNRSGAVAFRTNRWTELQSGMNVRRESDGQWVEAITQIEPVTGGAIARHGQTKVFFPGNLNAGPLEIIDANTNRFRCNLRALAFFDTATGARQIVALAKGSVGQILPSGNQILYSDAFTNGVKASVLYNYTKAGLQQCVVLDQQLPVTPADAGMNPDTTLLECVTEFSEAPPPRITTVQLGALSVQGLASTQTLASAAIGLTPLSDDRLDFGALKMIPGKAFGAGQQQSARGLPVGKSWQQQPSGNAFLFERVRYRQAMRYLTNLPSTQASLRFKKRSIFARLGLPPATKTLAAEIASLPAHQRSVAKLDKPMLVASAAVPDRDFIIDFDLSGGFDDYTLQRDTAYRIVGPVYVYQTLTIEGGTTVSYPGDDQNVIYAWGGVSCNTGPYAPGVFTSDGGGSALNGICAGQTLHDLRFTGFANALVGPNSGRDIQFVNCGSAFSDGFDSYFYIGNCLFVGVNRIFGSSCDGSVKGDCSYGGLTIVGENVTFESCGDLLYDPTSYVRFVNCILGGININVYAQYFPPQLINCQNGADYEIAGGGGHYLTADSSARGQGDPDAIDPTLLAELRTKTTHAPIAHLGEDIAEGTIFGPQVQLDSGASLDLGYHYDKLDHLFSDCTASGNITFAPGTVAGWSISPSGYAAISFVNTTVTFNGSLPLPDYWVRASTVQEQDTVTPQVAAGLSGIGGSITARFTRFCDMAADTARIWGDSGCVTTAKDCEFYGGGLGQTESVESINLTNCLLDRVGIRLGCWCYAPLNMQNCTMHGGSVAASYYGQGIPVEQTIRDCAFDRTVFALGVTSPVDLDYNAFSGADPSPSGQGTHDLPNVNFNWQTGPLGSYYLPAGSPLIDYGSKTAGEIGLYHYTTQIGQPKEASTQVDIAYHYLALDSNGNPVDTDGDTLPDYVENSSGSGVYNPDTDMSDWQNPFTDGSGMDDGWEFKYFGQINVDPYADPDNDGYGNLEEYKNATSPLAFNSPPKAVANVQVLRAPGNPSNVTVTWTAIPSGVTSYTITRTANGNTTTYTVPSDTTSWMDTSVPAGTSPTYTVTPNYSGGSATPSPSGNPDYNPLLAVNAQVVRGPTPADSSFSPLRIVLGGPVPPSVTAIRVYKYVSPLVYNYTPQAYEWQFYFYGGDYGWYDNWPDGVFPPDGSFDVPINQFINGVYQIPVSQLPEWCAYYFETQAIGSDGRAGVIGYSGFGRNVPFVDGSAVLKDNLSFILRSGETGDANDNDPAIVNFQANLNYAAVSPVVQHMDISPDLLTEVAAFNDNWFMKNWAYDTGFDPYILGGTTYYWFWWNKNVGAFGGYASGTVEYQFDSHSYVNDPNANAQMLNSQLANDPPVYLSVGTPADLGIYGYPCDDAGLSWSSGDQKTHMAASHANFYGLPYQNVRIADSRNPLAVQYDLALGGSYADPHPYDYSEYFQSVTPPSLTTVGYYFAQVSDMSSLYAQTTTPMPNDDTFTTAQSTPLIVTGVGQPTAILGWAKQQISNGNDPTKFAYLGQYFDKSYKTDANGNPTATETGILSEYGEFFPTEPGRFVLKTKPDPDQGGQQGQCTVYAVSLNVDANHDGSMDLTYGGADTTSLAVPMKFWVNNDNDGTGVGADSPVWGTTTPPDFSFNEVRSQRDLEDFARLWICGAPYMSSLDGYQVKLYWRNCISRPAIKLFPPVEADDGTPTSGTKYLTDPAVAQNTVGRTTYGEVSPAAELVLPETVISGAPRVQFLFEGSGIGSGELVLSISQNGKVLAESSVWLELRDVKSLYEQAHVANVVTAFPAMIGTRPLSTVIPDRSCDPDPSESKQVIVYVHGWRMTQQDYYSFSESMFKRLYWQGYKGRFASLRWPALSKETDQYLGTQYLTFNRSEHVAFDSANGAAQYFVWLRSRFADYSINVAAHSQGNIVMMEALKQMLSLGVSSIDNYVLMQAAVPAQCYDVTVPNFPPFISSESSSPTPDTYSAYPGNINDALRPGGKMINFFNPSDYAVGNAWVLNQELFKPHGSLGYYVAPGAQPYRVPSTLLTDPTEIMPFVARPRSQGLGVQGGAQGVILGGEINLSTSFGFTDAQSDHSGEFNRNIQVLGGFYQSLLQKVTNP